MTMNETSDPVLSERMIWYIYDIVVIYWADMLNLNLFCHFTDSWMISMNVPHLEDLIAPSVTNVI